MPESNKTPIVMVGPGTGIVPFIGFMEEREIAQAKGEELGEALLYFGCREKDSDYIYRDEMAQFTDKKVISSLNIAFSRQKDEPKQYVQNVLGNQREKIQDLIEKQNGYFYICGSTSMGKDVQNLLKEILGEDGFKKLETEKRLIKELW